MARLAPYRLDCHSLCRRNPANGSGEWQSPARTLSKMVGRSVQQTWCSLSTNIHRRDGSQIDRSWDEIWGRAALSDWNHGTAVHITSLLRLLVYVHGLPFLDFVRLLAWSWSKSHHDLENVLPNVSVLAYYGNICADVWDRAAELAVPEWEQNGLYYKSKLLK